MTETPAASSPAPDAKTESSPVKYEVPKDPAAYAEWRQSGKLPEPPAASKPEDSASSASSDTAAQPAAGDGSGAASEPAKGNKQEQQQKPVRTSPAEKRLNEILGDLKRAGFTPEEIKTFRREQAQATTDAGKTPPAEAPKAQTPKKLEPPKKPDVADPKFKDYAEYEAAIDQWHSDVADYRADLKIQAERERWAEAEQTRKTNETLAQAEARYGADAKGIIQSAGTKLATNPDLPGVIRAMLNDSPVLGDLLYVMGSNGQELDDFTALCKSDPGAAIRKLALTEHLVKEELAKGNSKATVSKTEDEGTSAAPRNEAGQFSKAPAKKVSDAPPPARESGGRQGPPPDEVERARNAGDVRAYMRAANERDLARYHGRSTR